MVFAGCALLHNAFALRCFQCTPGISGPCTDTQTDCPSNTQCGSMSVATYAGGTPQTALNMKTCSLPVECITASLNFGISQTVINNKCCSQDLCNSQNAPVPSKKSPNGKQCYTCIGEDCSGTLNCLEDEDSCISTKVELGSTKVTMKGCASKSLCSGTTSAELPGMSFKLNCCDGNLCNNAQSMGFSLLLLMAAMLSITLFH